jgi:hypothetical protein
MQSLCRRSYSPPSGGRLGGGLPLLTSYPLPNPLPPGGGVNGYVSLGFDASYQANPRSLGGSGYYLSPLAFHQEQAL